MSHPDAREKRQRRLIHNKKREYVRTFTMHGLTRICIGTRSESLFWILVMCAGAILGIVVVFGLVKKYLQYNVYTEVIQKITTTNFFPSITFCNKQLMEAIYFTLCGYGPKHFLSEKPCLNKSIIFPHVKNTLHSQREWSNNFFRVTYCNTWGNKNCANDRFIHSLHQFNNTCFTWNYDGTLYDIYSHADIFFKVNRTSQIIAIIHDPQIKEIDPTKKFLLDPNKIYDFKIGKTVIKRLPSPFPTNCTKEKLEDIFPGKYTRQSCIESIAYTSALVKCGGVYDYHKNFMQKDLLNKYMKHNGTVKQIFQCLLAESKKETISEVERCPFPCEELELQAIATFSERTPWMKEMDGKEEVFRVSIQYQNPDSYKIIEEKQLYGWDQILGEIGGLVGLMLGASMISLVEIFTYIVLCILHKFYRVLMV